MGKMPVIDGTGRYEWDLEISAKGAQGDGAVRAVSGIASGDSQSSQNTKIGLHRDKRGNQLPQHSWPGLPHQNSFIFNECRAELPGAGVIERLGVTEKQTKVAAQTAQGTAKQQRAQ